MHAPARPSLEVRSVGLAMHAFAPARCAEAPVAPRTPAWAQPLVLSSAPVTPSLPSRLAFVAPTAPAWAQLRCPSPDKRSSSPRRESLSTVSPLGRHWVDGGSIGIETPLGQLGTIGAERAVGHEDSKRRASSKSEASTRALELIPGEAQCWSSSSSASSPSESSRRRRLCAIGERQRGLSKLEPCLVQVNLKAAMQIAQRDETIEALQEQCTSLLERLLQSERKLSHRDGGSSSSSSLHSAVVSHTAFLSQLQLLTAQATGGARQSARETVLVDAKPAAIGRTSSVTSTCASLCTTQPGTPTSSMGPSRAACTPKESWMAGAVPRLQAPPTRSMSSMCSKDQGSIDTDDAESVSILVSASMSSLTLSSNLDSAKNLEDLEDEEDLEAIEALCRKSEGLMRVVAAAIGSDDDGDVHAGGVVEAHASCRDAPAPSDLRRALKGLRRPAKAVGGATLSAVKEAKLSSPVQDRRRSPTARAPRSPSARASFR